MLKHCKKSDESKIYGDSNQYHDDRRKAILKAHPNLRTLMQIPDPSFKYVLMLCMISHVIFAYLVRDCPLWAVILAGVTVGILYTCPISNSLHEIVHELAFEQNHTRNKIFGLIVNLPLVWPLFGVYHKSHRYHHTYLGTDLDIKYPDKEEALKHDKNFLSRIIFLIMHPVHSAERWTVLGDQKVSDLIFANLASLLVFDSLIFYMMGYKSFLYLLISFWLNECILIEGSKTFTDHWSDEETSHTMSYYGPINLINFNIGHHREHHDFPNIAGRYLSIVKKEAPEFYSDEDFIENNYFLPVWNLLTASPNEGLMRFANKIHVSKALKHD